MRGLTDMERFVLSVRGVAMGDEQENALRACVGRGLLVWRCSCDLYKGDGCTSEAARCAGASPTPTGELALRIDRALRGAP